MSSTQPTTDPAITQGAVYVLDHAMPGGRLSWTVTRRLAGANNPLELLLACQRLLEAGQPAAPDFPSVGETLGDFLLTVQLGHGAWGRVFLAEQLSLDRRQVVLKLSPRDGRDLHEHLSLARLQHTHIVPLYAVQLRPEAEAPFREITATGAQPTPRLTLAALGGPPFLLLLVSYITQGMLFWGITLWIPLAVRSLGFTGFFGVTAGVPPLPPPITGPGMVIPSGRDLLELGCWPARAGGT